MMVFKNLQAVNGDRRGFSKNFYRGTFPALVWDGPFGRERVNLIQPDSRDLAMLLEKMNHVADLSRTNEKLAAYIHQNYMKIVFMTAGQLAAAVGISQGSVTRFCISLDFRGYNDFLHYLQQCVSKEITLPDRLQYTTQHDGGAEEILQTEHRNIDEVGQILCTPDYQKLREKICKAKNLVLVSARMSATLLPYTFYLFNKIRNGVTQVTPNTPAWDTVNFMNPKDTFVLAFVFPRYANSLLGKLQELRGLGFDTVLLTDMNFPYIKGLETNFIRIPTTVHSIFDIYSAPILFINLLIRDVAKDSKNLKGRLDRLEKMESEKQIYYKRQD